MSYTTCLTDTIHPTAYDFSAENQLGQSQKISHEQPTVTKLLPEPSPHTLPNSQQSILSRKITDYSTSKNSTDLFLSFYLDKIELVDELTKKLTPYNSKLKEIADEIEVLTKKKNTTMPISIVTSLSISSKFKSLNNISSEIKSLNNISSEIKSLNNQYKQLEKEINQKKREIELQQIQNSKTFILYIEYLECLEDIPDLTDEEYRSSCKVAYQTAIENYYPLEQQDTLSEIQAVSENLISIAKSRNSAIVFIGRSLILCAAYIEKNYPEINIVKIPLSGARAFASIQKRQQILEVENYFNKHLDKIAENNNLLIADYIVTAESLNQIKKIISRLSYADKTKYVAVYSKSIKIGVYNEGSKIGDNLIDTLPFDYVIPVNKNNNSNRPSNLSYALDASYFDGISPYGEYKLDSIIQGDAKPIRSEDGFNLLKEMSPIAPAKKVTEDPIEVKQLCEYFTKISKTKLAHF